MTLFRRSYGSDDLKNGTILGGLVGLAVAFGGQIVTFLENIIPENWLVLNSWSIPIYLAILGGIVGYVIDKK